MYVFDRTHSTLWLAALGICPWEPACCWPVTAACSWTGTSVTVLIVSGLASAAPMTGMAVVVDAPVGLVLALSAAALVPYRSASGALTPEVVGEKDLAAASSGRR